MPSPAAALLAAYNGKPQTTLGQSYGGYDPFSGNPNPGVQSDPGAQAQTQVSLDQSAYYGQQNANRSQLASSLEPYSVGGAVQQDPGSAQQQQQQQFYSSINGINQRGLDQTSAVQQQQQALFQQKLSALNNQYSSNSADANGWLNDQMQNGASSGMSMIPTGADPNSNVGARAVALAQQVVKNNVPYVWGGNSLTAGVDCSGLVQQVYARLGIHLPRTSTEQARYGKIVPSLSQALPGDLILEYSPYEPKGLQQYGHVAIYIGHGMVIEAPGTGKNVRIGPVYNMTRIVRPW